VQEPLPYSASADRNKEAIGDALEALLSRATTVLEIGSGSGQHAVYLCRRFGHLQWQVTEQSQYLEGLRAVVSDAAPGNVLTPIELQVSAVANNKSSLDRTGSNYSFVYSANTAHIMGFDQVPALFAVVSHCLDDDGCFALYGPFKENGQHNSDGNRDFDASLRLQDSQMGIRDINELVEFASGSGLALAEQISMPANNRILLWRKPSG